MEVYEVESLHLVLQKLPDAAIEAVQAVVARPIHAPLSRAAGRLGEFFPGAAEPAVELGLAKILQDLPEAARTVARSGSAAQFRQALLQSPEVLRRLFCLLHPRWVDAPEGRPGDDGPRGPVRGVVLSVGLQRGPARPLVPGDAGRAGTRDGDDLRAVPSVVPHLVEPRLRVGGGLTTTHPLAYSVEEGDRVVERTVRTRKTTGARIGARGGPDLLPSIAYLKGAMRPSFALMA